MQKRRFNSKTNGKKMTLSGTAQSLEATQSDTVKGRKTSQSLSRRCFVGAAGSALAAPYVVPASALGKEGKVAPSERIRLALIGAGGMGRTNLRNCMKSPDVEVVGVCDVWKDRLEQTIAKQAPKAKPYHDFRELLQQPDLDAVIIATPPHWHCLIAIEACRRKKHMYLQKPMTLHVGESLAVKNAVKKHGIICQIGTQIHASENYRRVVEYVRSGKLGPMSVCRTFNVMNQGVDGIGKVPDQDPPKGLDWDLWVGPAPMRRFNPLIVRSAYFHSSFMAYSGGWTPGMAPHIIDLPFWALKLDYPLATTCVGGRYIVQDSGDAPDTQEVLWEFPKFTLTWSMSLVNSFAFDFGRGQPARRLGIYFLGVNGTLFCNYTKREVVPEGNFLKDPKPPKPWIPPSPGHEREWLDCIKSGKQPSCNPEYHSRIDVAIALANLSMKLGRTIHFDPKTEQIVGDEEAARLAVPEYRSPWKFPKEYLA